jgi:predicted RNA-binding Zn ribbon-like protein
MEALCLDIINSDWRGYRGGEPEQDRLLESKWIEQVTQRWGIQTNIALDEESKEALKTLRFIMRQIIQSIGEGQLPSDHDIKSLNDYLSIAPSTLHLTPKGEIYQLIEVPTHNDWHWLLREIARSFATLLSRNDPFRIKQCSNPACRWVYYDGSPQRNRCWCNETCATLMRVRRFRAQRQESQS